MQLYNCGFLQTTSENHIRQFWNAFQDALDSNIRGIDGKKRILSIIADTFSYETINEIYQLVSKFTKIIKKSNKIYIIPVIIRFLIIQLPMHVIMHVLMVQKVFKWKN